VILAPPLCPSISGVRGPVFVGFCGVWQGRREFREVVKPEDWQKATGEGPPAKVDQMVDCTVTRTLCGEPCGGVFPPTVVVFLDILVSRTFSRSARTWTIAGVGQTPSRNRIIIFGTRIPSLAGLVLVTSHDHSRPATPYRSFEGSWQRRHDGEPASAAAQLSRFSLPRPPFPLDPQLGVTADEESGGSWVNQSRSCQLGSDGSPPSSV
jgi:hypothetical protein